MDEKARELIADWFRRVRESQHVHYACANHFSRLNYILGIPTIVITSVVGTAVFVSLEKQDIADYKILVGLLSMLAAVLASLQTFLGFAERSEKHRLAGAGYAAVRRHVELLATFPPADEELEQSLMDIKNEMDSLAKSSPEVPRAVVRQLDEELRAKAHERLAVAPVQK